MTLALAEPGLAWTKVLFYCQNFHIELKPKESIYSLTSENYLLTPKVKRNVQNIQLLHIYFHMKDLFIQFVLLSKTKSGLRVALIYLLIASTIG